MPTTTNTVQVVLSVVMVMFTAYIAGRIHQWSRRTFERHDAFREGYDRASHALFHLATRGVPPAGPEPDRGVRSAPRRSPGHRHTALQHTKIDAMAHHRS